MDELPIIKATDFEHIPQKKAGRPPGTSRALRDAKSPELKLEVWQCYVRGMTDYRLIEKKTGVPKSTAERWIKEDIAIVAKERLDLAENFVEAELQRLDMLLEVCMRDVTHRLVDVIETEIVKGPRGGKRAVSTKKTHLLERVDVDIVDRILRIQERRAKYLALDQPIRSEVKHEFDLAELINAAIALEEGSPSKTIDAEFKETPSK